MQARRRNVYWDTLQLYAGDSTMTPVTVYITHDKVSQSFQYKKVCLKFKVMPGEFKLSLENLWDFCYRKN